MRQLVQAAVRLRSDGGPHGERSETVGGRLILQGAEDGFEGMRDGIGWSLSIDQESGDMVLTGSGEDVAFVIFGACTVY